MAGPVLEAVNLTKHFPVKRGILSRTIGAVRAVDDISFTIEGGKITSSTLVYDTRQMPMAAAS